jgi:hypothetical protein
MIACFLAAGLVVAAIYSVDWNSVFQNAGHLPGSANKSARIPEMSS